MMPRVRIAPSAAASRYQQLRSHLAKLKLTAAAEALPAVLDQATEGRLLGLPDNLALAVQRIRDAARGIASDIKPD